MIRDSMAVEKQMETERPVRARKLVREVVVRTQVRAGRDVRLEPPTRG